MYIKEVGILVVWVFILWILRSFIDFFLFLLSIIDLKVSKRMNLLYYFCWEKIDIFGNMGYI